jgi:hypothetical protein
MIRALSTVGIYGATVAASILAGLLAALFVVGSAPVEVFAPGQSAYATTIVVAGS